MMHFMFDHLKMAIMKLVSVSYTYSYLFRDYFIKGKKTELMLGKKQILKLMLMCCAHVCNTPRYC